MDWSNETYVRLYVRDTRTWIRLGMEGQCVFMSILRKVNRAGVIDTDDDDPVDTLLLLFGWSNPRAVDLVATGWQRVLEQKVVHYDGQRLWIPNFVEAQTAKSTAKKRQREHRQRQRDLAELGEEPEDRQNPPRSKTSRDVTDRHGAIHSVTPRDDLDEPECHESIQSVTPRDGGGDPDSVTRRSHFGSPRLHPVTPRDEMDRGVYIPSRSTLRYATQRYAEGEATTPPDPAPGGSSEHVWRGFLHQLNAAAGAVAKIPVKHRAPPGLLDLLDTYGAKHLLAVYSAYAKLCADDPEQRAFWTPSRLFREGVFSVADKLVSESAEGVGAGGGSKRAHRGRQGAQSASLPLVPPPLAGGDDGDGDGGDDADVDAGADALLRTLDRATANPTTH